MINKDRGFYIVTLNNFEPIHVNAQDKRDQGRSITVTKENCKFGKAKDFEVRKKNYFKTFSEENVNFTPIVALEDIDQLEKDILSLLDEFRMRGRTGRKNEWLEGITFQEVYKIAIDYLKDKEVEFIKLC